MHRTASGFYAADGLLRQGIPLQLEFGGKLFLRQMRFFPCNTDTLAADVTFSIQF